MASLQEVGKIIADNLRWALYTDKTSYVVHKDDFVTDVTNSKGKSWDIFKRSLELYKSSNLDSLVDLKIISRTGKYGYGIWVRNDMSQPYMVVLIRTKKGNLAVKDMNYDEIFIQNAQVKGVIVEFMESPEKQETSSNK